jgi:molybdopterin/thiamine biosynthesis adenylyltransferase
MASYQDITFSKAELARYDRHIIIPDFGLAAQQKLKAAKVLVIGSGGLGSPLLLYLAAAGVGTIGIVDFDVVDDSNLQRQVLFGKNDVGRAKARAAKSRLQALNPHIKIQLHNTRLTSENALQIVKKYDVVADGTDNFPTRYLVNDACVLLGKTNVYASIFQFDGQVSVFNYRDADGVLGPNYRDLYPTPPPPGLVPSCAEGGVLGVLPGIIGSMQANEVIKVIDYEFFCGLKNPDEKPIKEITVETFLKWQALGEPYQLIDVREPNEYENANIGGLLLPLGTVTEHADQLRRDVKVVVHCRSGVRSAKAIRALEAQYGLDNLYNLKGGILAYQEQAQEV